MSLRDAIEIALRREEVPADLLEAAFGVVMDGEAPPAQVAGLLIALRAKGETVGEIVAVARALRARATTAEPTDPDTVDTCGTGGSGVDTFNISTTVAFVAAGAGVPVAKHGNRAVSGTTGSFDVLEALGVRIDLGIAECGEVLKRIGIAPFFARTAHPAFRHIGPIRQELGVRTLMNGLGPLLNPVGARRQIVGVYASELVEPLARALRELGAVRALVVHGRDGMDELTTTGTSLAAMADEDGVRTFEVDPTDFGIERASLDALAGGAPDHNAAIIRAVLDGETGPARDIVLLNAAGALWAAGVTNDLPEGLPIARDSLDSGRAREKLDALVKTTGEVAEAAAVHTGGAGA